MSNLKSDQSKRILDKIYRSGEKGKRESVLIYEEKRYYKLGKGLTLQVLEDLIAEGLIVRVTHGPKKFKSQSNKEKYQIVRYYFR